MSKQVAFIVLGIVSAFIAITTGVLYIVNDNVSAPGADDPQLIESLDTEEPVQPEMVKEPEPLFDAVSLQKTIDKWVSELPASASASIVISDVDSNLIAEHNPDQVYFAASIYKLYVAYAGYMEIDAGTVDPSEAYINGNTRVECLDLMIRESDSPCAEKLWVELGKQELTDQLKTYGIDDTNMSAINTTAADAAVMLARIARGESLSETAQGNFLESMKTQIYRDALNKGFGSNVTVYNKIGFNGYVEYHDTAIIELKDGRRAVVSVLTENVGTRRIAELAGLIEAAIEPQQ